MPIVTTTKYDQVSNSAKKAELKINQIIDDFMAKNPEVGHPIIVLPEHPRFSGRSSHIELAISVQIDNLVD